MRRASVLLAATAAAAAVALGSGWTSAPNGAARAAAGVVQPPPGYVQRNTPYDGRFTFARISFEPLSDGFGGFRGRRDLKWDHDFPRAERNLMKILSELTTFDPVQGGGNVFALDDPELMRFPIAYVSEPGFWNPTDAEAAGLRTYLTKGGFIIFDDFFGARTWDNFAGQMRRVMPELRPIRLDEKMPVFDAFFHVERLEENAIGYGRRGPPEFWGFFEDNDPSKRMLAVANYNNDIGESWEYSDEGAFPVEVTSASFKLGINYLMYGMTR